MSEIASYRMRFFDVIEEVHRQAELDPPSRLLDDHQSVIVEMEVLGESFKIEHNLGQTEDRLVVSCRLGELSPTYAAQILRSALQLNHRLAVAGLVGGGGFCTDADERDLLFSFCMPIEGLTSIGLQEQLMEVVDLVSPWLEPELFGEQGDWGNDERVDEFEEAGA